MLSVNIEKRLGDFELKVQFETDNTTLALLGASGCGKSITLKCIAGIMKPDKGSIVLNGRILFDSDKKINLPPQSRRVGYLFQEYALFPNMTVEQNILTALHNRPRGIRQQELESILNRYQLTELRRHKPYQLSGGQKQRTALARIMVQNPEVILLDEPFSALDSYLKFQLELDLLDTLNQFPGDVIFVSHSRNEVSTLCKDVCILTNGKTEPKENVSRMLSHPLSVSAALLSRCANFTPVRTLKPGEYFSDEWNLRLLSNYHNPDNITTVGIRAGTVKPILDENRSTETDNVFWCTIVRIVDDAKGDIALLLPDGAKDRNHYLRMDCSEIHLAPKYQVGDQIKVSIQPRHVMALSGHFHS